MSDWRLRLACRYLARGGIVAYPTEAVYGLGCDPLDREAVHRLLGLKRRPAEKGFILIAASFDQLQAFLAPLPPDLEAKARADWPGPVTWIWPARPDSPDWLRGRHDSVAVRVTAHPLAASLCRAFGGAIVSTSANVSGRPAARSPLRVRRMFHNKVDYVLHGPLGSLARPTEIRDARSGRIVRRG